MKWIFFAVVLAFFTACNNGSDSSTSASSSSSGPAYYVSSSSGDDANPGTSTGSPWKTLDKVENFSFPANSTLYLKKGDVWFENLVIPRSDFTLNAYGTGALPVLDGSYTDSVSWTDEGSGVFSTDFTVVDPLEEGLGNITVNGSPANFLGQITSDPDDLNASVLNTYSFDSTNDTLFLQRSTLDASADSFKISWLLKGIDAVSLSNIHIKNIRVQNFSLHGIEFKDCNNCNAYGVEVQQIGGAVLSGTLQAGNGIEYGSNCSGGTVELSTVSDIFDSCLSPQTYASNQTIENITFKDSTVSKCGFAGVEISVLSNGGSTGSQINNTTIDDLNISYTGQGWSGQRYGSEGYGIRIQADAGAGSISNTIINETEIEDAINDGINIFGATGNTTISRSKFSRNHNRGIYFADLSNPGNSNLDLHSNIIEKNSSSGVYFYCSDCTGFEIYQNTFYENSGINLSLDATTDYALLKNNIFDSSAAMTHLYTPNALNGANLDFNCYQEWTNMIGYAGTTYHTLTSFQVTGLELHGIGGDPDLFDPSNDNFSLTAASACKNGGDTGLGVTIDYGGNSFDTNSPSMGALQY
jgi:hypothetical protein